MRSIQFEANSTLANSKICSIFKKGGFFFFLKDNFQLVFVLVDTSEFFVLV